MEGWARQTSGSGVSIRLPGIVGAGGRNNFLSDSLQRILADEPVIASNPDAPFNNVVHVEDLAAWVIPLCDRMPEGHNAFTIAADEPLTIRDTLARLYRKAGREPRICWQQRAGTPFNLPTPDAGGPKAD